MGLRSMKKVFAGIMAVGIVLSTPGMTDVVFAETGSVIVNENNFPDVIFRSYVAGNIDKNHDGILSQEEMDDVTEIDVSALTYSNGYITSVKGVEYFTNLTKLNCGYNQITSLDVSKNTKLTTLDCYANELTELNVSKNTELTNLACEGNKLTNLDVTKNTLLSSLACKNNALTGLNVSNNTQLKWLSCNGNKLTDLDVSKNTQLKWLVHRRGWHKVLLQEQRSSYQSVVRGTGQLVLSER